eukprot:338238-Alexandrium_andersonii.AAC.1
MRRQLQIGTPPVLLLQVLQAFQLLGSAHLLYFFALGTLLALPRRGSRGSKNDVKSRPRSMPNAQGLMPTSDHQ